MSTVENGNTVSVHYTGTLTNGSVFDTSREREPLNFVVGSGQVIAGFNDAVVGMVVGESKTISLPPDQAYGEINPQAVQKVPRTSFPSDFEFVVGNDVQAQNEQGTFRGTIADVDDEFVVVNFNHPLAGHTLNFEIELVSVT